jgi:hypothetical protein
MRVQWEGETQTLRSGLLLARRFEQRYKIGEGRVESREKGKLGQWNFGSLAIAMAEIVKI